MSNNSPFGQWPFPTAFPPATPTRQPPPRPPAQTKYVFSKLPTLSPPALSSNTTYIHQYMQRQAQQQAQLRQMHRR